MKRVPDDVKSYFRPQVDELHADDKELRLSLPYREEPSTTVLTKQAEVPFDIDQSKLPDLWVSGYPRTKDEHLEDMWSSAAGQFEDQIDKWLRAEHKALDARGPEGGKYLTLVPYQAPEE